jgi:vancomycin resistance protein YoaR
MLSFISTQLTLALVLETITLPPSSITLARRRVNGYVKGVYALMDRASSAREAARRPARARQPRQNNLRTPLLAGLLTVAAVLILGGGIAAALFQIVHGDQIYPGVAVGDVQIGGMTKDAAEAKLRPSLGQRAAQPLSVREPDTEKKVTAADLGATFDSAAAVDAAFSVGRSGNILERLSDQVKAMTGGYQVEAPGLRLDRAKLAAAVSQWALEIDRSVRDSAVKVGDDLTVTVSTSVVGRKLDQAAATSAVERALTTGATSVTLPVAETQPKVVDKDVEAAKQKLTKMLSGPVSLEYQGSRWTLSPKEIAAALSVDQKSGDPAPVVTLNDAPLQKLVGNAGTDVDQAKTNARFDWNGGALKQLSQGQDGRNVDRTKALALLTEAVSSDQRTVTLPVNVDRAAGVSIDPAQLGIKQLIISDTTSFYGSVPERAHNIQLAASRLNGVLLAPGDTFSFNHELGPTTLKAGFQMGFGIVVNNGQMETVPSEGGGICQVATTLFHDVFWAGYQLEERYPHAYWIRTYGQPPLGLMGLDTTVDPPNLDFKFTNNTNNYLLIQSGVQDSTVSFSLYGTKPTWKVEVDQPVVTNVVKPEPGTAIQEEPTWPAGKQVWVDTATDGMDVSIVRRVIDGGDVRTLNVKSRYAPVRNVLAVGAGTQVSAANLMPAPGATAAPATTSAPAAAPIEGTPAPQGATPTRGVTATPGGATAPAAATPTTPKPQPTPAAPAPSPTPKGR